MAQVDNIPDPLPPKPVPNPPFHVPGAIFFVAVVVILSLLPLQAPEFVLVRGWELLHLLLIAIAVSCGLFSGKYSNADPGAGDEADSNMEATPVSPGFSEDSEEEEEEEHEPGWPVELEKTQLWSSLYHRPDPPPLVTEEKRSGSGCRPLCLPVRSLRLNVVPEHAPAFGKVFTSDALSSSGGSSNGANVEMTTPAETGEEDAAAAVGASPLSWRSRSARMTDTKAVYGASGPPTPTSTSPYLRCASTGSLIQSQCVWLEPRTRKGGPGDAEKSGKLSKPSPPPTPPSRRPANPDASAGLFLSRRQVRSRIPREEPDVPNKRRGQGHQSNTGGFGPYDAHDPVIVDGRGSGSGDSSDEDADKHGATYGSSTATDAEEDDGSSPSPEPGTRNEVDRKAEEFIAKIKKQIRRQKVEPGNQNMQDTNTNSTV